jgi:hypothetical protein
LPRYSIFLELCKYCICDSSFKVVLTKGAPGSK